MDLFCTIIVVYSHAGVWRHAFDAGIICVLAALKAFVWPRELVVDQFGLHSCGFLPFLNSHIPWKEVGTVRTSVEVPGFGPRYLGLRNDALEVQSKEGSLRIVHTPHHPDRDRFMREVRLRGVKIEESALP